MSRVVRTSNSHYCSRNCSRFDTSILRHSGILGAADEAVLKKSKKSPFKKKFFGIESEKNTNWVCLTIASLMHNKQN
jgi:hypothetical protein